MQKGWTRLNRKFIKCFLLFFLVFSFAFSSPAVSEAANPVVRLETTQGDITIELYPDQAPKTVANFLFYVTNGFYDGDDGAGATIFHRVMSDFVIQGGGFSTPFYSLPNPENALKNTTFPIPNEADNGLKNEKYTISMARTGNPHSATSQFFINLKDNEDLDFTAQTAQGWGYAVFGRVVGGMNVVDEIGSVSTTDTAYAPFANVPQSPITIIDTEIEGLEDLNALNQTLYYSPAVLIENWGTEVCVINNSDTEPLSGLLRAYFSNGQAVSGVASVSLPPNGRKGMAIQEEFPNAQLISHFKFQTASESAHGYSRIYGAGVYQAAVPAVKETDRDTLSIPIGISNEEWFTAISLLNTDAETNTFQIELDGTVLGERSLAPGQHTLVFMKDLFGEDTATGIHSAVLRNASNIVGHAFIGTTGSNHYLSGFNLKSGAPKLFYPLLINAPDWWTGVAAQNPSSTACELRITPYTANGVALGSQSATLAGGGTWMGIPRDLGIPENAAWLQVEAENPDTGAEQAIAGLELIGTADGNQMIGVSAIETGTASGILPRLENQGWSAFIFTNTAFSRAHVTLSAYNDHGEIIATNEIAIESRSQALNFAEAFFGSDISNATYIRYDSDRKVAAFQVDASADNLMMEGLGSLSLQ